MSCVLSLASFLCYISLLGKKIAKDSTREAESLAIRVVPEVGIEPTRSCPRGILSPVRLPVSPLRRMSLFSFMINYYYKNKKIITLLPFCCVCQK